MNIFCGGHHQNILFSCYVLNVLSPLHIVCGWGVRTGVNLIFPLLVHVEIVPILKHIASTNSKISKINIRDTKFKIPKS